MESMVVSELFEGIYRGRRVLVTGHTGFKGSWLSLWLSELGAEVHGVALPPPTKPSHFELLPRMGSSTILDIRDKQFESVVRHIDPEIVFHLAAQPLVRLSYEQPLQTFLTNIIGTANLLEVCRKISSLAAVVIITSDKCYEEMTFQRGYRESDALGGFDPYSASKGCAEIVSASYRRSFFAPDRYGDSHHILLATARAGNVIGGGDWSIDRLVPDIMRAVERCEVMTIRNPDSIRAWQHVLDCLNGYLLLGQKLLERQKEFAEPWNFGPNEDEHGTVLSIVEKFRERWDRVKYVCEDNSSGAHEAAVLMLDCAKSREHLGWRAIWSMERAVEETVEWYRRYYENGEVTSLDQIRAFTKMAAQLECGAGTS